MILFYQEPLSTTFFGAAGDRTEPMKYHYTTIMHLAFILLDGHLKPSRREAHGDHREGLLWFSTNNRMEMTARKGLAAMIRFGTNDERIKHWRPQARRVGFDSGTMRRLERSGRKMGAKPSEWLAMNGALSIEDVAIIEMNVESGWESLDLDNIRVKPVAGGAVELIGVAGLAAVVARQRTPEGYFAYGTNAALYRPERILVG